VPAAPLRAERRRAQTVAALTARTMPLDRHAGEGAMASTLSALRPLTACEGEDASPSTGEWAGRDSTGDAVGCHGADGRRLRLREGRVRRQRTPIVVSVNAVWPRGHVGGYIRRAALRTNRRRVRPVGPADDRRSRPVMLTKAVSNGDTRAATVLREQRRDSSLRSRACRCRPSGRI